MLHIQVQVQCYCSVPIDPKLVHTLLKHLVSDANSYKVMDTNVKKTSMLTKCKLTTAMIIKIQAHVTCVHIYTTL